LDYSNNKLINDLNNWLNIIRDNSGNDIPIFVVGSSTDLKSRGDYQEILSFVESNNLDGFYLISTKTLSRDSIILNQISKKVLEHIKLRPNFSLGDNYKTEKESEFQEFANFFSFCPLCYRENHKSYLKKFFYDTNDPSKRLREKLVGLMERSKRFENIYENEIKIGIPCCECFKKLFSE
jgi:GTPase SAR1 family protein